MERSTCTSEEFYCEREGKRIYGRLFRPRSEGRLPLVIFCHELGRSHTVGIPYAERLTAAGYACAVFDFCGGTVEGENRSDGTNLEMSVVTESRDTAAVLHALLRRRDVDPARTAILGASQGGIAGMLAASREPEAVKGLIMMYPPLGIAEGSRKAFGSPEAIPEEYGLFDGWIRVGRCYAADMWDLDFYEILSRWEKPMLLLHGDRDRTAPPAWSERAASVIPDCEFHLIPGAGHHFSGRPFEEAMAHILRYLERQL